MQYPNPSNQFNEIINLFIRNDCSIKLALSFISNNLNYILKHKEIANKIFFICNNTEIYAILIVNDNNYYWSICHNNTSYPLEEKTEKNNPADADKRKEFFYENQSGKTLRRGRSSSRRV